MTSIGSPFFEALVREFKLLSIRLILEIPSDCATRLLIEDLGQIPGRVILKKAWRPVNKRPDFL